MASCGACGSWGATTASPARRAAVNLPNTRNGKVVRRMLGAMATGGEVGDTTALEYSGALVAGAAGRLDYIGRVCTGRAWGRPTR